MRPRELINKLPPSLRRDGEIILSHLMGIRPAQLPLLLESDLPTDLVTKFKKLIEERQRGVPTAYLIGEWEFMGRVFKLKEGVLVPRPETELLVEKVLEHLPADKPLEGLDIGTGSGCIAVTLLLERPLMRMTATDINPRALEVALENARIHGVEDRLDILEGDLFTPVRGREFDLIVSNPPYIPSRMWDDLPEEVRREGELALLGGEKGWEFYERMADRVKDHLKEGGLLALEIGHDQGEVVKTLLTEGGFKEVMIYRDYSGQDRVVMAWS